MLEALYAVGVFMIGLGVCSLAAAIAINWIYETFTDRGE